MVWIFLAVVGLSGLTDQTVPLPPTSLHPDIMARMEVNAPVDWPINGPTCQALVIPVGTPSEIGGRCLKTVDNLPYLDLPPAEPE